MADELRRLGEGGRPGEAWRQVEFVNRTPGHETVQFRRFNATLTGDISATGNMLTIWDPTQGHRYRLRRGRLSAMFTTKGTGTGVDFLMLVDDGTTLAEDCLVSLGPFSRDAPAGQVICSDFEFSLDEGPIGSAKDAVIRVAANGTIGSGVIRVSGELWGDEDIR